MPFYDHLCEDCNKKSEHMYSIKKDPKEIECPHCNSKNTRRLIGKVHFGWERKIYKTFLNADDERAAAQETDHMGPQGGYGGLHGEEMEMPMV